MKLFSKHTLMRITLVVLILLAVGLYIFVKNNVPDTLKINEIAFSLESGEDWVEIYNPTVNNLSLKDFYLTDSPNDYTKFQISEDLIVPSRGYAVIYGDGYEGDDVDAVVANFRISNGETIYLVSRNGETVVDQLTAISADDEATEFSVGRFPDGGDQIFTMTIYTPGAANQKDRPEDLPIFEQTNQFN